MTEQSASSSKWYMLLDMCMVCTACYKLAHSWLLASCASFLHDEMQGVLHIGAHMCLYVHLNQLTLSMLAALQGCCSRQCCCCCACAVLCTDITAKHKL
jgi:hypothetical protein